MNGPRNPGPPENGGKTGSATDKPGGDRKARLSERLRQNLRRRKDQARLRRKDGDPDGTA